jgi:hypothetical protein
MLIKYPNDGKPGIGKGASQQVNTSIRGDVISWIDVDGDFFGCDPPLL